MMLNVTAKKSFVDFPRSQRVLQFDGELRASSLYQQQSQRKSIEPLALKPIIVEPENEEDRQAE